MDIASIGLIINFFGCVLLGASSQCGSAAGWGGDLNWKSTYWRWVNIIGWFLLAIGFLLQFYAAYQT